MINSPKHYLYSTPSECCSKWYPDEVNCPMSEDDGVQDGLFFDVDMAFHPNWKGNWCELSGDYPEWMAGKLCNWDPSCYYLLFALTSHIIIQTRPSETHIYLKPPRIAVIYGSHRRAQSVKTTSLNPAMNRVLTLLRHGILHSMDSTSVSMELRPHG